jgi:hypothetical protein
MAASLPAARCVLGADTEARLQGYKAARLQGCKATFGHPSEIGDIVQE